MGQNIYSTGTVRRALHTYISFKLAVLVLAFAFQIIIAKILSPAHFATYAILLATLMAGERALSFGIDRTILRFVPNLTQKKDTVGLRALIARVALIRLAALIIFGVIWSIGAHHLINSIVPIQLKPTTLLAFAIWFVSYTFIADADAFAQSWMAHFESAFAAMLEIVTRTAVLIILVYIRTPSVEDIVVICASTSTIALILVVYRLRGFIKFATTQNTSEGAISDNVTFNPKRAPMFALANFASTMSYLISSPPVIRIMATAGLDVIGLAAFSFAQGLYISLQRLFPGLLILPTLEPIVMSQLGGDGRDGRVYAGLSLLFKTELVCILSVVIVTSIAGFDIIEILSRPAYAQYYYILPILIASLTLITSYRLFELIANTNSKQHIFFGLWPLSLLAMCAMYMTVQSWGLVSILFWPIAEISARIAVLTYLLRKQSVWRVFDPGRSILLILCAGAITAFFISARTILPIELRYFDLALATLGLITFIGSLFALRPLRTLEYESLLTAVPASLRPIQRLALMLTRN